MVRPDDAIERSEERFFVLTQGPPAAISDLAVDGPRTLNEGERGDANTAKRISGWIGMINLLQLGGSRRGA
jgi:hypothetical protein